MRRAGLVATAAVLLVAAACRTREASVEPPPPATLDARIAASLERAETFLESRQGDDGAWRSEVYGAMRDGPSLTTHVLSALWFLEDAEPVERGMAYLTDARAAQAPLLHPVYTSAAASWLCGLTGDRPGQQAWLRDVLGRQAMPELGWSAADAELGGWGYSPQPPRRPTQGGPGPMVSPNLSSTCFAAGAMRFAGLPPDHPAWPAALAFTQRCQNWSGTPEPAFDDGGFFHAPTDPAGNKAGAAGVDASGRERYRSYGSMTADGVRVLLACGLPQDHPRVAAARAWLEHRFDATANPGDFEADRLVLKDATYYYWCWSAAHACNRLGLDEVQTPAGRVRWSEALAEALLERQQADGSWRNAFTDSREDDPLVATPFAVAALEIARRTLAGAPPVTHHR